MEPLAGPLPVAACPLPASRSPSCRGSAVPNRASWDRLAHVVLPHDWMTYRLTGTLVTDRGDTSGTGYWSPAEGRYRYDLLSIVDPDRDWVAMLPEVLGRPSGPACGGTRWWRPAPATTWPEPWASVCRAAMSPSRWERRAPSSHFPLKNSWPGLAPVGGQIASVGVGGGSGGEGDDLGEVVSEDAVPGPCSGAGEGVHAGAPTAEVAFDAADPTLGPGAPADHALEGA